MHQLLPISNKGIIYKQNSNVACSKSQTPMYPGKGASISGLAGGGQLNVIGHKQPWSKNGSNTTNVISAHALTIV